MSKFLTYIKAVFVATINICLLCGAGYVFDWFGFVFKKTTFNGRRIKRIVFKASRSLYRRQLNEHSNYS
jgi:hypothetical protein